MKITFTFIVAVSFILSMFQLKHTCAQSPQKMSYQAVIRDINKQLVTNQTIGMQISILHGSFTGPAVFIETQNPTTNTNGLVSIEIGAGTKQSGDFITIDWTQGTYFVKTETDPTGGTSYSITGISQLLSVPFALHSKTAEKITGTIAETDPVFTTSQAANITASDINNLSNLSGTNTGDQDLTPFATKDMGNNNITNLADPVNEQDAATKAYVTLTVSETGDTLFLGSKQWAIIPGISNANAQTKAEEIFLDSDRPFFNYIESDNQYALMPWNYNKSTNINRNYPLVIFLHGMGGAGVINFLNYIGYDDPENDKVDSVAYHFQKEHPCFTLVPQTSGEWNNASLIEQVEKFKSKYRIDESRIYLIGYSMGGSGSWSFANAYNEYNGHLFAGIIRLAGQSQTQVTENIAENTAMWLHIGLDDAQLRIDVTREAYNFLSEYHNHPQETTQAVPIEVYTGITYSLILSGEDFIKRTEYEDIGHGIYAFPFKDPYLIEWLFRQKL